MSRYLSEPLLDITSRLKVDVVKTIRMCMIVTGVVAFSRGVGYVHFFGPDDLPFGLKLITTFIPIDAFALLWMLSAIVCFYSAVKVRPSGTFGVVGMCIFWATGYLASWVISFVVPHPPGVGVSRDYLGAFIYGAFGVLLIGGRKLAIYSLQLTLLLEGIEAKKGPS